MPILSLVLIAVLWLSLRSMPHGNDALCWFPFVASTGLFALGFFGMAYSFYPYVVPEQLTLYEAASAPESLLIILVGVVVVMPMIGAYTILSYYIFRGKATDLSYD